MIPTTQVDSAAARLITEPLRHLYAILWRFGVITTDKDNPCP